MKGLIVLITKSSYNKLEKLYGDVSSWAIWKEPDEKPKSNTSDMSVFDDENILDKLNDKYVFVGLNASSTHGERRDGKYSSWLNFHSDYAYQQDYKLRYALLNTKYWGGYITDIIKKYPEVDSSKVKVYLKNNPEVVESNIKDFINELNILSKDKPILIAMGGYSFEILDKYLSDEYKIVKIMHYSSQISKEEYRKQVLDVLDNI